MKHVKMYFLIMGFALMSTGIIAQTAQGTWLLGGGMDITYQSAKLDVTGAENSTNFGINLNPLFGYFLADNLAVGAEILLGWNAYKSNPDADAYKTTTFGIGPVARYYIPFTDEASLFGQVGIKYTSSKSGDSDAVPTLLIGAGPGIAFFLNESIALNVLLTYNYYSHGNDTKVKGSQIMFGAGFGIHLAK